MTRLRHATSEDAAAIAHIRISGWRQAYPGLVAGSVLDTLDEAADTQRWAARLGADPAVTTMVAELDETVRGFCTYGPDRDEPAEGRAEIYGLYVLPAVWGSGLGRRLVEAVTTELAEQGNAEVRLWALAGNHMAHGFYLHVGFRLDGGERPLQGLPAPDGHDVQEVRYRLEVGRAGG
jgi:GNAT superfamily N-acetyltransferase